MTFSLNYFGDSFFDLLKTNGITPFPKTAEPIDAKEIANIPHGTTILAVKFDKGVIIAGDRRATEGMQISGRSMQKIYRMDDYSAVGIAGAAGPAIELCKLLKTELEHYEKLEGMQLSLEGKANKLGQMIRANFPMAIQGLVVVPIFAGYDLNKHEGRIYKYDITGGAYEEVDFNSTGSGGKDARGSLKKNYKPGLPKEDAVSIALEALYDAADEDAGTGGPDLLRRIFPTVFIINETGVTEKNTSEIEAFYLNLIERKKV